MNYPKQPGQDAEAHRRLAAQALEDKLLIRNLRDQIKKLLVSEREERDACAKVAEELGERWPQSITGEQIAAAIRKRGEG